MLYTTREVTIFLGIVKKYLQQLAILSDHIAMTSDMRVTKQANKVSSSRYFYCFTEGAAGYLSSFVRLGLTLQELQV